MKKQYNSREFKTILNKNGYNYVRSRGSHSIYKKGEKEIVVTNKLNLMICRRIIKENNLICG